MKPLDISHSLFLAVVSAASTALAPGAVTPVPLAAFSAINGKSSPLPLPANYTLLPALPLVVDGTAQFSSLPTVTWPANETVPVATNAVPQTTSGAGLWMGSITHGSMPYAPSGYPWFRNVMDYGATGDGTTDDTAAINAAVSAGGRCVPPCNSTSVLGAVVYFPSGTYLVSEPIFQYYYTQFVGDPTALPTIKGTANFTGIALIDTDYYIPGASGEEWYQNQNQFLRQIRNFNFDLTEMELVNEELPPTGIHWQTSQSTSLQNLNFNMPQGGGNGAVGIFTESGSGGFMSDLTFSGGNIGLRIGSQQFTIRNLQFTSTTTAISHIWNWGFTWKGLSIHSCSVGIDVRSAGSYGPGLQPTASIVVLDSVFDSVGVAVLSGNETQVMLDNVEFTGVTYAIQTDGGIVLYDTPGGTTASFALGTVCTNVTGACEMVLGPLSPTPSKSATLVDSDGNFFVQSKPQYESLAASDFLSVTAHGAMGDGETDDTAAINAALQSGAASGQVVFFPMGVYIVTGTILVPAGSKVVGDGWPQMMASGSFFQNASAPGVMVQVGQPGDVGSVQISDMLWTVRGATAGAVLMEWNIQQDEQGSAGMWDSHFRVGGAVGSNLQAAQCPPASGAASANCTSASLLLHLTNGSSGYFENVWAWTADHDMDVAAAQNMVQVYAARGILVESSGPNWFYGSASEHHVLYQYQLSGASNTFLGWMQTETPYYQSSPAAPEPFSSSLNFANDPSFDNCVNETSTCAMAWALRVIESDNVYIYGAGFYSSAQQFSQDCLSTESCQDAVFQTASSQGLWIYDLVTKGAVQVLSPVGGPAISQASTQAYYLATVMAYLGLALNGSDVGGTGDIPAGGDGSLSPSSGTVTVNPSSGTVTASPSSGTMTASPSSSGIGTASSSSSTPTTTSSTNETTYFSPSNAQIQAIPNCTTLAPSATFTLTSACVTPIINYPVSGNGSTPQGPSNCWTACDLLRLLTQTCCGYGGTTANPVEIPANVPLPAQLTLPAGFTPTAPFTDHNGTEHSAGVPLPSAVTIDAGTSFTTPFSIPSNISLPLVGTTPSYDHDSPSGVGVVPLSCTTVAPSATFTMSAACTPDVSALPADTQNNNPPGPAICIGSCSFLRRLTGTCCGSGGSLLGPIVIAAGIQLPLDLLLPIGFILPLPLFVGGITYPAGVGLAGLLAIPMGTVLSSTQPFIIPAGTAIPDDEDDEGGSSSMSTGSIEAIYNPSFNLTYETAAAFAIALMLAVNGNATATVPITWTTPTWPAAPITTAPDIPSTTAALDTPSTSTELDTPSTTAAPDTPSTTPDTQDTPSTTTELDTPSTTTTQDTQDTPSTTTAPDTPSTTPDTQDIPSTTTSLDTPSTTTSPDTQDTPSTTTTPTPTAQDTPASSAISSAATGTLNCQQNIPTNGPTPSDVAQALLSNNQISNICDTPFDSSSGPLTLTFNHGFLDIAIARPSADEALQYCAEAINAIINTCILGSADYGGIWNLDDYIYNITNMIFPNNPLIAGLDPGAPPVSSSPSIQSTVATQVVPGMQTVTASGMICILVQGSNDPDCQPQSTPTPNPSGTNLHMASAGCIVVDGTVLCQGSTYNVADQNQPWSTVTIYAQFDGSNSIAKTTEPGCGMTVTWPANYGDIYYKANNCLEDSQNNTIGCCTQAAPYEIVTNPYYNSEPAATCGDANGLILIQFYILGKGWITDDGQSLQAQVKGCGAVTGWDFSNSTEIAFDGSSNNIGEYEAEFSIQFNLPLTFKDGCVGRAIVSAGGPSGVNCDCSWLDDTCLPPPIA